jgi:hypothetical protein
MKARLFMSEIICDIGWFQCLSFLQLGLSSKARKTALQSAREGLIYVSNVTSEGECGSKI